ncbi:hypothetical protein SAMN05421819_3183 [Bryocella elongata]|uniref:Excinuclease ABC subunit C n=1 Tax=Bryocella elongata TaxID=863522 RepID=A0A1H6AK94_9BACT|nr:excinuclease ABC subunit C [Bryocella elongata]SEG48445.1 hypothetical protein SAMN05421819_3183 [Bryocella elongata]
MSAAFHFEHNVAFDPEDAERILRQVPAAAGVFALRGADASAEPYLTRAADIRRRLKRLLAPPELSADSGQPVLSKRLNLRNKVRFIEWTRTGSEFESVLVLYCATRSTFGAEAARKRLRLHAPYFLRITQTNAYPRVYATNKLSKRSLAEFIGPYPSRAAAERHCDAVLELFKLRRCYEDLAPYPDHPGCVYGEMGKCLRPCQQACTDADYRAEADKVAAFFTTRGESMLTRLAADRDAASEAMDFERAAALHAQYEKARAAANLADEIVRPAPDLRALIVQKAAPANLEPAVDSPQNVSSRPEAALFADAAERPASPAAPASQDSSLDAAIFLFERGRILGPARLSTLGVRAVREQTAVGSSLFAQPLMLAAIPLDEPAPEPSQPVSSRPEAQRSEAEVERAASSMDSGSDLGTITNPGAPEPALSSSKGLDSETRVPAQPTPFPAVPPEPWALGAKPSALTLSPEDRARAVLADLHAQAESAGDPEISERCDFLSLFRRWYYRPERQRSGEPFLPNAAGEWPIRRILNAAARAVLGPPAELPPVQREAAKELTKDLKTRTLHEGREGVERTVPVLPKRSRRGKAVLPSQVVEESQ